MHKQLSKSVIFLLIYDLLVMATSTVLWADNFNFNLLFAYLLALITTLTGFIVFFLKDNYKIREFNNTAKNTYLLFEGVVFTNIPLILLMLIFNRTLAGAVFALINITTIFTALKLYRIGLHFYLFNLKKTKNVLIVGTGKNAKIIADEIINKKALKMQVIGLVEDYTVEDIIEDKKYQVFKQPLDIAQIIEEKQVDIVIISTKQRMEEKFLTHMALSIPRRVKLYKMADFYEMVTGKYFVSKMTANHLFYEFMNRRSIVYDVCKRLFDIIAASIILTLTFPILFVVGIRVKMTDGGAAIYTQNRVGKGGKLFKCYKLRTMYANDYVPKNVKQGGYAQSQDADDRVIPFCKFVRKARFDEIPQMINIIKGEMSIVGPRTEWEEVANIYTKEVPYYPCRMWVNTGWTGWAQINQGHCFSNDDEAEKIAYDLYYLKHRNVLWEIGILIKAVFLALGGRHG